MWDLQMLNKESKAVCRDSELSLTDEVDWVLVEMVL
jgi:hypothetical protein